jgi:phasin family protein
MSKASPQSHTIFDTLNQLFAWPPVNGLDRLVASQRQNYDTMTKVAQLTAESFNIVLHRQFAFAGLVAEDGSNGVRQWLSAGTNQERITLHTDLAKTTLEKGLAAVREVSDLIGKANAEAVDLVTKRVAEGLTEWQGALSPTPAA